MNKQLQLNWREVERAFAEARARIPAHLDSDELIANAWNNTGDITEQGIYDSVEENVMGCFFSTVDDYIDQDCSTF